eukprot:1154576-Pelagomonas_calceolata.AAC.2
MISQAGKPSGAGTSSIASALSEAKATAGSGALAQSIAQAEASGCNSDALASVSGDGPANLSAALLLWIMNSPSFSFHLMPAGFVASCS